MSKTVMICNNLVSVGQVIVEGLGYSHFIIITGILYFQCSGVTLQQHLPPHYFILKKLIMNGLNGLISISFICCEKPQSQCLTK